MLVRDGRAAGVRLADGEEVARRARGDRERHADAALRAAARRSGRRPDRRARPPLPLRPLRDADPLRALRAAALGGRRAARRRPRSSTSRPGLDGVSRAVNEAERGLLPAEATVVVGQPLTMDAVARARGRRAALDPAAGAALAREGRRGRRARRRATARWTEELRERYADRIQARIARHVPNLESALLKRVDALARRPRRRRTSTCTSGDPYSGSLALDQNLLWRPFPASPGHATPVEGPLAHRREHAPGPGLGAGSGTMVAKQLLEPGPLDRLRKRLGR